MKSIFKLYIFKLAILSLTMIFINFGATAEEVWKNHSFKNEMTGKQSYFAFTKKLVKSTNPMSFPYNRVTSYIALMCTEDNKKMSFSFLFNIAPNITNKEIIVKNFDNIKTRIKFGEKITNVELLQKWGGKQVTLRNHEQYLDDLKNSNEILLELDWHGNGKRYFRHSIIGFSKAYEELKTRCGA